MKQALTIISILFFITFSASGQFNNEMKDNTILVKGTAILNQVPELIYSTVTVKAESMDYSDCQDKTLSKLSKVKEAFLKHNIDEKSIHTGEIAINERRDVIQGKSVFSGFTGNISLVMEAPYSGQLMENLLSALKDDSLSVSYTIAFRLSEAQKSALRQEAIAMAIDDSKEKAALISKSAGVRLGRISSVTYLDDQAVWSRDNDIIREDSKPLIIRGLEKAPGIEFSPREIGIVKSVRIEWIIER